MLVEQPLRLLHRHVLAHGDEVLFGHQLAHALAVVGRETDVAVGENADELARLAVALDHGNARNVVALHQRERVGERRLGPDGQRIDHHAGFEFLHPADLVGLLFRRQIPVDNAHAARLGHRDGEACLRDRIHGRRYQRDAELDLACQPRPRIDLARQHGRGGGDQKNIVKRKRFANCQGVGPIQSAGGIIEGASAQGRGAQRIFAVHRDILGQRRALTVTGGGVRLCYGRCSSRG